MGHERTSASRSGMSALPPKADMFGVEIDVCSVPLADMASSVGPRPIASQALPASDCPTQIVANWCTYGAIKPSRIASTTAWMRFFAPSFFIVLSMCHSTVRAEM